MISWAVAVAIVCSEPRLEFRAFYDKATYGAPWPGYYAEQRSDAMLRMLEVGAAYLDYAAAYRDKCR